MQLDVVREVKEGLIRRFRTLSCQEMINVIEYYLNTSKVT